MQRFVTSWSGLIAPVDSVGERADLAGDVREQIRAVKGEDRGDVVNDNPSDPVEFLLWHRCPGRFAPCMLLRLGEGELASQLWEAQHARDNWPDDPYPRLASRWLSDYVTVSFAARRRGEDARALHIFRRLVSWTEQAEARQRGVASRVCNASENRSQPRFNSPRLGPAYPGCGRRSTS